MDNFLEPIGAAVLRRTANFGRRYYGWLTRLLVMAGERTSMAVFVGRQVLFAVLLPLLLWPLVGGALWICPVLALAGWALPLWLLRGEIQKRQQIIARQLPDALDLLTIAVEAGLDFLTSLRHVVAKQTPGPLQEELGRFFKQIELGRRRRDALRELGQRVDLAELSSLVAVLIQADRLGASIGPILRSQSDMLRTHRLHRAEKQAQEAPMKMLAPLMFCVFPAVFIIILVPLFIQMQRDWSL